MAAVMDTAIEKSAKEVVEKYTQEHGLKKPE